jgi:hypothetical protein
MGTDPFFLKKCCFKKGIGQKKIKIKILPCPKLNGAFKVL